MNARMPPGFRPDVNGSPSTALRHPSKPVLQGRDETPFPAV